MWGSWAWKPFNSCNQGREGMQRQARNSQETIVQPWGRVLVPPQGDTHNSMFKLFFRAINKSPTKWKMFHRECHSSITLRSSLGHYLIQGVQALHTPRSLSATLPLNSAISSQVGIQSFSVHPPLPGRAIELLFSTSSRTLFLRFDLTSVHRGQVFHIVSLGRYFV